MWNFKQTRAKLLEGKIAIKTQGESGVVNTVDEMNRKLDATEGGTVLKSAREAIKTEMQGQKGKLGMAMHACNPSTWEVEARGALGIHACPWLHIEFKINLCYRRPDLKQQIQARETGSRGRKQAAVRISRKLYVDKVPNTGKGTGQGFERKECSKFSRFNQKNPINLYVQET